MRGAAAEAGGVELGRHHLHLLACPAQPSLLSSLGLVARKQAIWGHVTAAAAGVGGVVPDSARGGLLEEVSNLVESPTVVLGGFDPAFLALPR